MNIQLFPRRPWLALSLLGIEYVILGWYLAARHILWLIATFLVVTTLTITWKRNPMLKSLDWLIKQQVFVVIGMSLLFSLAVVLAFVKPILLSLILLPLLALLYALLEMQITGFNQLDIFLWSVMITGLSLGLGEAIDLLY